MSSAYEAATAKASDLEGIKRQQREWLSLRNDCEDIDCLEMAYRNRIGELSGEPALGQFLTLLSKEQPLCDRYKRYLEHEVETRPHYPSHYPAICDKHFGPTFPEFQSVRWREISPQEHPRLAVEAYRYINFWPWDRKGIAPSLTERAFKDQLDTIKLNHSNNWWHMWLGEADIGNTGHTETLLRVEDGRCGELSMTGRPPSWSVPVMVVNKAGSGVDTEKSEWILGVSVIPPKEPPERIKRIHGVHELNLESYDIFVHSDMTYLDRVEDMWAIVPHMTYDEKFAAFSVYMIAGEFPQLVCRYKFGKQK